MALTDDLVVRLTEAVRADRKRRDLRTLEGIVRSALVRHWRAQKRAVLAALATKRTAFAPDAQEAGMLAEALTEEEAAAALVGVGSQDVRLEQVLQQSASRALRAGGGSASVDLAVTGAFDVAHPAAVSFLADRGARQVAGIDATTRDLLRTLLTQAADEGWSYDRTARQIRQRFDGFSDPSVLGHIRTRAELVAVTEVGEAYEEGRRIVRDDLEAAGVATEKSWLTAGGDVCDVCSGAAGDGWVPGVGSFSNGMDSPLGHPGCRCDLLLRAAPDQEGEG